MPGASRRASGPFASVLLLASLTLAGCATQKSMPAAKALGNGVDDLTPASLAAAADRTVQALGRTDPTGTENVGPRRLARGELLTSAKKIADIARESPDAASLTKRIAKECRAYPLEGPAKITGYYEPVLEARTVRDGRFRFPLYRAPSDEQLASVRKKLGRIPTRDDIDGRGALSGLGLELAWLDDPVERFFLHVQGSGRLEFPGGRDTRVGFAGTNDLAYRSVGTVMMERGILQPGRASAPAMKRWLSEHSAERDGLLALNPRYVFFRDTGAEGPIGSLGASLTAGRSVAADDRYVPPGVLLWLKTTRPVVGSDGAIVRHEPITRFAFAQDAGAAIKGPARLDLFVGSGDEAGIEAGGMNQTGEAYALVCTPRGGTGPLLATPYNQRPGARPLH